MADNRQKYIPAIRYRWLTPLYDPLLRFTMRDSTFKRRLLARARIEPGQWVLDLGCGTATLTVMVKKACPGAEVVGLDGDPKILEIARSKAARAGVDIIFDQGMAFDLPYPDESFDRVLSSLLFHHLTRENKGRALREAWRVLKKDGELHVADFGKPHNPLMYLISLVTRHLEEAAENVAGLLPQMFKGAGFGDVEERSKLMTVYGTLSLYKAARRG